MTVDSNSGIGTWMIVPHFGHLMRLPAAESGPRTLELQLRQVISISIPRRGDQPIGRRARKESVYTE